MPRRRRRALQPRVSLVAPSSITSSDGAFAPAAVAAVAAVAAAAAAASSARACERPSC